MDVDVVYTWVDAQDPIFSSDIQFFHRPSGEQNGVTRYRNNDELRYSLRSVAMFAPWVRNIYIVTNGQCPAWLNTNHPQIHLIHHREIFLWLDHLPTFNSQAIECHLHRIPGLSEQFIYFNDDNFMGCPAKVEDFFSDDGKPLLSNNHIRIDSNTECRPSVKKTRDIFAKKFGEDKAFKLASHQALPLTKTLLLNVEHDWPDEFEITSASRFRTDHCVELCLALWNNYAYYSGYAKHGFRDWRCGNLTNDAEETRKELAHIFEVKPVLFCLFDRIDENYSLVINELNSFLNIMYPKPSPFELG